MKAEGVATILGKFHGQSHRGPYLADLQQLGSLQPPVLQGVCELGTDAAENASAKLSWT